jgi:hypothetical protein
MLRWLIRGYVLDRLLRALAGRQAAPRPGPRYGYPRSRAVSRPYPTRTMRPTRGRGGFAGPFPYYTTRTRRGSQVSVGGCCLPIPLGFLVGGSGLLLRRLRRRAG